ncbi:major capsid protein [Chromobacterium rhizoryzae]|uniref:major capsid protein n=1 Tax=Chromobacterium rhizoryzae TaxID=1778675 RepID=UPI001D064BE3|nr:major capsid protein [Chromobacterium rhizoryzae]
MKLKRFNTFRRFALPFLLASASVPAFAADGGSIDVSTTVALIAGGVAIIAAVGGAKMGLNGVLVLWGYVKSALART